MRFDELDLEDEILDGLYDMNFSEMTPVQEHTIAWAQVGRVVWGADDPKKGYRRYSEAVFHPKTTVGRGVLREECESLMGAFFASLRE